MYDERVREHYGECPHLHVSIIGWIIPVGVQQIDTGWKRGCDFVVCFQRWVVLADPIVHRVKTLNKFLHHTLTSTRPTALTGGLGARGTAPRHHFTARRYGHHSSAGGRVPCTCDPTAAPRCRHLRRSPLCVSPLARNGWAVSAGALPCYVFFTYRYTRPALLHLVLCFGVSVSVNSRWW